MFQLKQKDEETFDSDDALFEVNKKLANKEINKVLKFKHYNHKYMVDFKKQEISIDGKKQDLNLVSNSEEVRWINFRRNTVELTGDRIHTKKQIYYMGFQVTINGTNHKRMIKIDKDVSEIVNES